MALSVGRPTIIDTDPGIDDALAILLALASPELEVRGISTVAGNIGIETTTRNAGRLLALAHRPEIPVLRGAAGPLARQPVTPLDIHGADGIGGVPLPEPVCAPGALPAVEWMASVLMAEPPHTVDILALGPLTNLAALVQAHPEAARRIGRVIAMGGAIDATGNSGPRSEFNMAADPEAAAIILQEKLRLVLVPLDVTRQVRATRAFVAKLASSGNAPATAAAALIDAYFASTSGQDSRPLHDPCVVLFALRPELFGTDLMHLKVQVGSGLDEGTLIVDDVAGGSAEVVLRVHAEHALSFLRDRLASPALP
ncbi:MAG TPA: nucleoside hydrolase [Microvirga sp.]|jgi:purine nucleosidase/pyrimidine-specific ribonucleoside hydrolase|nr:nucleoside hydrolase [Microvirga sp.]